MAKIEKSFYTPHPKVKALSHEEADKIRADRDTEILGGVLVCPKPVVQFALIGLPSFVMVEL